MGREEEFQGATWGAFEKRLGRIEDLILKMLDRVSSTQSCVDSIKRTITALQIRIESCEKEWPKDCEEKRAKLLEIIEDRLKDSAVHLDHEITQFEEQLRSTETEAREIERGVSSKVEEEIGKTVSTRISDITLQVQNLADAYGVCINDLTVVKMSLENLKKPFKQEPNSFDRTLQVLTLLIAVSSAVATTILGILTFVVKG